MIRAAVSGDADGFDELHQIVTDQHDIGAFTGNIGSRTHGDANCRFAECGSVVDAVSEHGHRVSFLDLLRDEGGLLFRQEFGISLSDAERSATASATAFASPVSRTTLIFMSVSALTAGAEPARN